MKPDEGWRRLPLDGFKALQTVYYSDPVCCACLHIIENKLLSSGIVFTKKDFSVSAAEEFQQHINNHFVLFCKEALVQLNIYGFCFFYIDKDIPRIIQLEIADVRFRVNTDLFCVELGVFRNNSDVPDESIFQIIDQIVDPSGLPRSNTASYYRNRILLDTFIRNAVVSDTLNSCPPVYTSTNTNSVFADTDIAGIEEIENLRSSLVNNGIQQRNKSTISQHAQNEHIVRMLNAARPDERVDKNTGLKHYDAGDNFPTQQIIPLPNDARTVQAPRAVPRTDLHLIMVQTEQLACVSYGVNLESVGLGRAGGHVSADSLQLQNQLTDATIAKWQRLFTPVLLSVYDVIWGGDDGAGMTVLFPSTMPHQLLDKLYALGILKHTAFIGFLHERYKLPTNAFEVDRRKTDEGKNMDEHASKMRKLTEKTKL